MKTFLTQLASAILLLCGASLNAQTGWQIRQSGTSQNLLSLSTADAQNYVAVGMNGTVITSADAGITWKTQQNLVGDDKLNGVVAITRDIVCVVGPRDTIFRSSDGGTSWNAVKSRVRGNCFTTTKVAIREVKGIDFDPTTKNCVAVGDWGEAIFSADSGKSWAENNPIAISKFQCVSSRNGLTLGGADIGEFLISSNGGSDWKNGSVGNTIVLSGADVIGWTFAAQHGIIYHSTNTGGTWDSLQKITSVNLNGVSFANDIFGFIVGDSGVVLMTHDGGYNWSMQRTPTEQNLRSVRFTDPFHGVICGDSGVILTTVDGGFSAVKENPSPISAQMTNHPNPITSRTEFDVFVPVSGRVSLKIYNMLGVEVATVVDAILQSGLQKFEWNTDHLPSGAYVCKLVLGEGTRISHVTIAR